MMKSMMKKQFPYWMAQTVVGMALLVVALAAGAQAPVRFLGTVTAISGNTLSVKTDADGIHQVNVPATADLKRIAPGQKDLSAAEIIQFSNLETGDRVRVKLAPNAPAGTEEALQIIAMKQSDLALKQQKDREDWQLRGVGGLVKSVDTATGVIVLSSGTGATAKTITVHTTKATSLKRYAPASVRFDDAKPAPMDAIHTGDQLRARGTKNADGMKIDAEDVVSGSFRNIAGTIVSLDAAISTLVVKDLATKKPVTVHIAADAQMKRLPDRMAQLLATRLKGNSGGSAAGGGSAQPSNDYSAQVQRGGGGQWGPPAGHLGSQSEGSGQSAGQNGGQGGDPQQMLNRAPAIQLSDLKKGDAVMLVSTDGTTEVTAITLLAGVEPLLEAPAATQNLLSNWSMNSGAGAAEAAAQ
ncbi:MAG: hypothetical protein ABSC77_05810 [Terracidiphilus sp.]|jgi:hypothetical protein